MSGGSVGTAAAWYTEPNRSRMSGPNRRPSEPSPRAFEARGLAALHHILVQLSDVGTRPRFAEACKAFGDVVWCDDLEELTVRATAREALAVIVDVADRQGTPSTEAVAAIRRQRPDLPIVVWCERDAAVIPLARLVAAGVSALIFRDETDLERRLLGSITRSADVAFHQLTDQALFRRVPDPLIPAVRYCLDHAAGMPRVEVMARAVGLRPRSLAYQLRRAGLPPVSVLVAWSKALLAAYRLEHSTESTLVIARSLGFSSGSALSRLLKRCANETAQGLREPGGFGWVLRCFERHLAKAQRR
jgi:AraC-like DNA-binding protein